MTNSRKLEKKIADAKQSIANINLIKKEIIAKLDELTLLHFNGRIDAPDYDNCVDYINEAIDELLHDNYIIAYTEIEQAEIELDRGDL